jgi:transcription initiation factor TFIIE subunit alpha
LAVSAAPSSQHTPSGEFSVLGDFEEDRKPNIEYLDSLNKHNKRSRSVEDESSEDTERKLARVVSVAGDGWGAGGGGSQGENGEHMQAVNGVEDSLGIGMGMDADDNIAAVEDDPTVYGPSVFSSHS